MTCLLPICDSLDSVIGLRGLLLLLVLPQFAAPSSVPWVRLEKGLGLKEYNLDVRNIFVGSHTEHHWRCSKENQNVSGQQQDVSR
jgi:hypothetical protein